MAVSSSNVSMYLTNAGWERIFSTVFKFVFVSHKRAYVNIAATAARATYRRSNAARLLTCAFSPAESKHGLLLSVSRWPNLIHLYVATHQRIHGRRVYYDVDNA